MRLRLTLLSAVILGVLFWAAPANAGVQIPVTWCGGAEETSVDRPDTVNGLQWHVVYAYASDTQNRFPVLASGFTTDIAAIAAWFQLRDPSRVPRFDLAAFLGCTEPSVYGALDITVVQLPRTGAEYQANATTVMRVTDDLNAMGYGDPDKKTLVYYDGPYDNPTNCGKGITGQIDGGKSGYAVIFLAACSAIVGTGVGGIGLTAAHEMIHAMNALPVPFPNPGPPNVCGTSRGGAEDLGHPCESALDIMFPVGSPGDTFFTQLLDVGNDDYYAHPFAWWDVQDSFYLRHLDSTDTTPPTGPAAKTVTATSVKRAVTFKWAKAKGGAVLGYRVYTNGMLFQTSNDKFYTTKKRTITIGDKKVIPKLKRIIVLGVAAIDPFGNLGPLETIRFRVGVGIVNQKGKLLKDTVPPSSPKFKKSQVLASGFQLRWSKAVDVGGKVKSYRLVRNKRLFAVVPANVRSYTVPFDKAVGTWNISAADRAKNVSPRTQSLTIS